MADDSDPGDLFPGFAETRLEGDGLTLHARIGGEGPPLVLLHGYPQCHVMWHRIAPELARHFTCIIPDLRGYGQSDCAADSVEGSGYSKRAMGNDIAAAMSALGHDRFAVAGHDRGARVGYRMALDHADRVERLVVLDILPTADYWLRMDRAYGLKMYHWLFLAQPAPMPETLIGGAPAAYLEHTIASWSKAGDLSAFDPRALDAYRGFFAEPERIHAVCEDYRAGAGIDRELDEADQAAGRRIACPVLTVWGETGLAPKPASEDDSQLSVWRRWTENVTGAPVDSGHFVAEENPQATLAHLIPFLTA
ncbi:MAG: alpha/beta hydrolase [Hyphomicrobiales bacterium]|mgnify:CR=1 FL=1|nr:MAG: alpha/beta hydrolase [Hyphomicrobiales bacterium]